MNKDEILKSIIGNSNTEIQRREYYLEGPQYIELQNQSTTRRFGNQFADRSFYGDSPNPPIRIMSQHDACETKQHSRNCFKILELLGISVIIIIISVNFVYTYQIQRLGLEKEILNLEDMIQQLEEDIQEVRKLQEDGNNKNDGQNSDSFETDDWFTAGGGFRIMISHSAMTHEEAKSFCKERGVGLVTNTALKNDDFMERMAALSDSTGKTMWGKSGPSGRDFKCECLKPHESLSSCDCKSKHYAMCQRL